MKTREKAILVLPARDRELMDWTGVEVSDARLIQVWNYNMLSASIHLAQDQLDIEVTRVIFDQSVSAEEWLDFLSSIPLGFRGDLLLIVRPGQAFLSAVGRADERVIYKLGSQDIEFYLQACGIENLPIAESAAEWTEYQPQAMAM